MQNAHKQNVCETGRRNNQCPEADNDNDDEF